MELCGDLGFTYGHLANKLLVMSPLSKPLDHLTYNLLFDPRDTPFHLVCCIFSYEVTIGTPISSVLWEKNERRDNAAIHC